MCDYSLHTAVASGPAKVGDKLALTRVSPRPSPIGKRTVLLGELFEPGLDQLLPRHTSARLLRRNDPALVPSNLNIDHRSRARTRSGHGSDFGQPVCVCSPPGREIPHKASPAPWPSVLRAMSPNERMPTRRLSRLRTGRRRT